MTANTLAAERELRVLQLVPSPRPFFDQQVAALERLGVDSAVVAVPGSAGDRGPAAYARFAGRTVARNLEAFDVVHANYGLTAPFALAGTNCPVVVTLWGSDVMGPSWLRRLSLASAARAAAVVVPSRPLARAVDCDHELIPFGVDTDRFRPIDRSTAREAVGWPREERIVLFPWDPSRPVKRHDLAERVVARVPGATLRTVHGVPHERMPAYLSASDAVLVTSERESGPMVVREAAACNVPVVSRDVGFAADVLADVEACAVVEGEAALASALERVLGRRTDGRRAVEGLDPDRTGDRLADLYRSVLR